jgi:hypothetical protein
MADVTQDPHEPSDAFSPLTQLLEGLPDVFGTKILILLDNTDRTRKTMKVKDGGDPPRTFTFLCWNHNGCSVRRAACYHSQIK